MQKSFHGKDSNFAFSKYVEEKAQLIAIVLYLPHDITQSLLMENAIIKSTIEKLELGMKQKIIY